MTDHDRVEVVDAMTRAATKLGWRAKTAESSDWRIAIVVLPPLARRRPERDRWPNEPRETAEGPDGA